MKLPEPAPADWQKIYYDNYLKFSKFDLQTQMDFLTLASKANEDYDYWDKIKYYQLPETISSEFLWAYLKSMRTQQAKPVLVLDKKGIPFKYWLPDSVQRDLYFIDMQSGGQILGDDYRIIDSEKERYWISSLMEEAIASSQLEGAAATREKAKEMLREGKKPQSTSEQMILNNYITIKNIKNLLDQNLSPELIKNIHTSIVQDTMANEDAIGRFRKPEELIQVIDVNDGQVLFDPPPAEVISPQIEMICLFINNEGEFVHPLVKAIILHFAIGYIHPFVDGNGRTARALFYWYMLKHKYWIFEFLSISRILLKAPGQYERAYLYTENDDQDLTYFIRYNLKAICLSLDSLKAYLKKRQQEIKESEQFVNKYPGLSLRQYELLRHAVIHPDATYNIKFVQNTYNVVYQTARADLLELEKRGFLEKKKIGKKFIFVPVKDIHSKLKGSNT